MKRLTLSMLTALLFAGITAKANLASADERFAQAREAMATDLARGRALYETAALDYLSAVPPVLSEASRCTTLATPLPCLGSPVRPSPAIAARRATCRGTRFSPITWPRFAAKLVP